MAIDYERMKIEGPKLKAELTRATKMTSRWEHLTITDATGLLVRRLAAHGYQMWQRIMDDEPVFVVTHANEKPSAGSGGYRYLDSAVKQKGLHNGNIF